MWYVIRGFEADNALAIRAAARDEHRSRLTALLEEARLLIAGPLPRIDSAEPGPAGFHGSLVIAEFAELALASAWAEADPYLLRGAWTHVEVLPFVATLP